MEQEDLPRNEVKRRVCHSSGYLASNKRCYELAYTRSKALEIPYGTSNFLDLALLYVEVGLLYIEISCLYIEQG